MPPQRLRSHLEAERRRLFVGRRALLQRLEDLVQRTGERLRGAYLYGPPGIGKTAVLAELRRRLEDRTAVGWLDVRGLPQETAAVEVAVWGLLRKLPVARTGSHGPTTAVLLADGVEWLRPIDGWLWHDLLPQLPGCVSVVLASRAAPDTTSLGRVGWSSLIEAHRLGPLGPGETRAYLRLRGVPVRRIGPIASTVRGHPLTLALAADSCARSGSLGSDQMASIAHEVAHRLAGELPTRLARRALYACALVRTALEPLLERMLGIPDAGALFDTLAGSSLLDVTPRGLRLDPSVRAALDRDLELRNPDAREALRSRALAYLKERTLACSTDAAAELLLDQLFLFRDRALPRSVLDLCEREPMRWAPASEGDGLGLAGLALASEGPRAAEAWRFWHGRHRAECEVLLRTRRGAPVAGAALISLGAPDCTERDPAARAAVRHLHERGLRREGSGFLLRVALARSEELGPLHVHIAVRCIARMLEARGSALSFLVVPASPLLLDLAVGAGLEAFAHGEPELEGTRCFVRDWRTTPRAAWLAEIAARIVGEESFDGEEPALRTLRSEPERVRAVREALKDLARPDHLLRSPLTELRSVAAHAAAEGSAAPERRAAALRAALIDACYSLSTHPRSRKFFEALERTYVHPARSQESAAAELGIPFTTYRYRLGRGIRGVAEILFLQEAGRPGEG